jgi:hypothetical protein
MRTRMTQNGHYAHEHDPRFRHFCAPKNALRMTRENPNNAHAQPKKKAKYYFNCSYV